MPLDGWIVYLDAWIVCLDAWIVCYDAWIVSYLLHDAFMCVAWLIDATRFIDMCDITCPCVAGEATVKMVKDESVWAHTLTSKADSGASLMRIKAWAGEKVRDKMNCLLHYDSFVTQIQGIRWLVGDKMTRSWLRFVAFICFFLIWQDDVFVTRWLVCDSNLWHSYVWA